MSDTAHFDSYHTALDFREDDEHVDTLTIMERLSLDDLRKEKKERDPSKEEAKDMQEIQQPRRPSQVLTRRRSIHAEDTKPSSKPQKPSPKPSNASTHIKQFQDYEDLRESYNAAVLEIRKLRSINSDLETVIQNGELAISHPNLNKSERAHYYKVFEQLERKAARAEYEYIKREEHLQYLTKQTREANNERDVAEEESRKLQRKIRDLQTDLTECRDDLLRLQPASGISDSEMADLYSNLCQQVATWVDDQTEDPDVLEDYFDKLGGVADLPMDVRTELDQRHFRIAKSHPECLPLMMQYVVHGRLKEEVLGPNISVYGLDETNASLLQGIEEGMGELEPKRDSPTLRRWRSETLQGLLKMADFAEVQQQCGEQLAQSLASTLSAMLCPPPKQSSTSWQSLHSSIVLPAIKLSNAIRVATTDYEFFSHLFARPASQPTAIHRNWVSHYQMLDQATQKVLRADSPLKVRDDGRIGDELFVVSPGVVRTSKDGKERSVLVKPTLLVKLDEPLLRKKGLKPLGTWGFGWLGGGSASGGGGGAGGIMEETARE